MNQSISDPQKSVPCITAIGYNGVQVWQNGMTSNLKLCFWLEFRTTHNHVLNMWLFSLLNKLTEGFVGPEDLASSLEKAWLSLHIQVYCGFTHHYSSLMSGALGDCCSKSLCYHVDHWSCLRMWYHFVPSLNQVVEMTTKKFKLLNSLQLGHFCWSFWDGNFPLITSLVL